MPSQMQDLAAWLLTYALHSTILLGLAWAVVRVRRVGPGATDVIWKVALVGGIVTATAQGIFAHQPAGTFALDRSAAALAEESSLRAHEQVNGTSLPDAALAERGAANESVATPPPAAGRDPATAFMISPITNIIAVFWLVVAVLLIAGYTARRLVLLGRLGDRRVVGDQRVTGLLDALRAESGVRAPIRLTTSRSISSPVALNGEICLPAAVLEELEPDQQRAMLAHELAHVVRRDPQWLAAACLLERAFFFQPLNRLARRGVQSSAEYLADEWAARRAGGVPLARALVKVAEWIQASPLGVPVAGFAEERSQLTARVARLLDRTAWTTRQSRWGAGLLAGAMLILTTAFAPGVSRSFVEEAAQLPGAGESSTTEEAALTMEVAAPPDDAVPTQEETQAPAQRQDTSVVAAVIERLKDEDDEVRRAAADALGRLQHPSAIAPLVGALEDENPEVRRAALDALGNFERGVPPAPIRRLLTTSTDAEVRSQAAQILGQMRDLGSVSALTAALADANIEVRQEALDALDEIDAPIADATIAPLLEDRASEVRQSAADMAGERRMVTLVPALIRMLDDASGDVRESAAEALTEMRTEESHRALRMAITHPDARVRRVAVEYLGEDGK